jgi:hypothetical protein
MFNQILRLLPGRKRKPIKLYSWSQAFRYYLEKLDIALSKAQTVTVKALDKIEKALAPLQPITKAGDSLGNETYDNARKSQQKSFNLSDFGIREFSDNDDWITMTPGKNNTVTLFWIYRYQGT